MLKYQLSKHTFDNDVFPITYSSVSLDSYAKGDTNAMFVTIACDDVSKVKSRDMLNITSNFEYYNEEMDSHENVPDSENVQVYSVDQIANKICFLDNKYKNLNLDSLVAEVHEDEQTHEFGITWVFDFMPLHYFSEGDNPIIYITYNDGQYVQIDDNLKWDSFHQLSWTYDRNIPGIVELSKLLFGDFAIEESVIEGNIGNIIVTRDQVIWDSTYNQEKPNIYITKPKVKLSIPIELKPKTDLHTDDNIEEYFIEEEQKKAINTTVEMEKQVYTPVVVKNGYIYEDCLKINFNLHFRDHNGKDWTVDDSDSWVFDKYGYSAETFGEVNKYYSYSQTNMDADWKWKRSCQSDLLTYLDFTTNDVKYQKNKLKKSFLRLSYYDSPNSGDQRLLAYSTVYVDNNKLYSKFISRSNFECYFDDIGNIVKGIKVDREVNTGYRAMEGSLMNILDVSKMSTEEIEDYRLSSQISVKNKFSSTASSEGFYLYTWESEGDVTIPFDVYMKVEFNHAGYGRSIPMMAPYKDDVPGFKTNYDIINDWTAPNKGYGIKKYTRYSYIHLKAEYDNTMKRYIYYLDPATYGVNPKIDGNIININLYEARISFD